LKYQSNTKVCAKNCHLPVFQVGKQGKYSRRQVPSRALSGNHEKRLTRITQARQTTDGAKHNSLEIQPAALTWGS
jgi:hypothetical protein